MIGVLTVALVPIAATRHRRTSRPPARRRSSVRRRASHRLARSASPTPAGGGVRVHTGRRGHDPCPDRGPRRDRHRDHGRRRHDHRCRTDGHGFRDGVPGWNGAAGDVDPQPPGRARHRQLRHRAGRRGWRDRRVRERRVRPRSSMSRARSPRPLPPRAGRFEPVAPTRLLDTRAEGGAPLAPGGQTTVALPSGVGADATAGRGERDERRRADRRVLQRLPSGRRPRRTPRS